MERNLPVSGITFIYFEHYEESCRALREGFGFEEVIDYGYAKLYRTAEHCFVGAVNRGQVTKRVAPDKGVTICMTHASRESLQQRHDDLAARGMNPPDVAKSKRLSYYSFTMQGPEGYRFEFGTFVDPNEAALLNPPRLPDPSFSRE